MEDQIQSTKPNTSPPVLGAVEKKSSKKVLILGFIVLLILIPLVMFGVQLLGNSNKHPEIVVNQKITPSPESPSTVSDTNSSQLDKEAKTIDDGLNSLDSSLSNIDKGLNDTQVNLE